MIFVVEKSSQSCFHAREGGGNLCEPRFRTLPISRQSQSKTSKVTSNSEKQVKMLCYVPGRSVCLRENDAMSLALVIVKLNSQLPQTHYLFLSLHIRPHMRTCTPILWFAGRCMEARRESNVMPGVLTDRFCDLGVSVTGV